MPRDTFKFDEFSPEVTAWANDYLDRPGDPSRPLLSSMSPEHQQAVGAFVYDRVEAGTMVRPANARLTALAAE